jgi:hypothetical protein
MIQSLQFLNLGTASLTRVRLRRKAPLSRGISGGVESLSEAMSLTLPVFGD